MQPDNTRMFKDNQAFVNRQQERTQLRPTGSPRLIASRRLSLLNHLVTISSLGISCSQIQTVCALLCRIHLSSHLAV